MPFLRDWGSVIFFEQSPVLSDFVFVLPQKIATLMSDLISFDASKPITCRLRKGILEHRDLVAVWPDYPAKTCDALLECEVALPLPGGSSSLVPAMLDSTPPSTAGRHGWTQRAGARQRCGWCLSPFCRQTCCPGSWSGGRTCTREAAGRMGRCSRRRGGAPARARVEPWCTRTGAKLDIECGGSYPRGLARPCARAALGRELSRSSRRGKRQLSKVSGVGVLVLHVGEMP